MTGNLPLSDDETVLAARRRGGADARPALSWALCVATYNRIDALARCVRHALSQTNPPSEIIIVDSSDSWLSHKETISGSIEQNSAVALKYIHSETRSSTVQRNICIETAASDVLFLIDDDSFMYPDCAETVLEIYRADVEGAVAGVCAVHVAAPPALAAAPARADPLERKDSGRQRTRSVERALRRFGPGKWLVSKVLFQSRKDLFIAYDDRPTTPIPPGVAHLPVRAVATMPGYAMTVRRSIALRERFDPALRFYAAFEDLDATYRYGRHGALLVALNANMHHFEARSGRIPRQVVVAFQLLNMLVFILRHAADRQGNIRKYRSMLPRRLVAEAIKDLMAGRWRLPQAAGVFFVMRHWRQVAAVGPERLDDWYPAFQRTILERAQ